MTGGETSLLIDTLYDVPLTREMLDAMRSVTATRPIDAAVNTHGNGDHCYGNAALPDRTAIYASVRAVADMREEPPARLQTMLDTDLGPELNEFAARIFGPFRFEGLEAAAALTDVRGTPGARGRRAYARADRGRTGAHGW